MNVIQSFVFLGKHKMSKHLLYQMFISCYLANKFYGNCKLYTNQETWDQIKNFNFPYSEVNVDLLDNVTVRSNAFAIPKIMVFADQTNPFIHIDFDTFLNRKLDIEQHNEIVYSYDDISFLKFVDDDLKGQYTPIGYKELLFFYDSYFKSVLRLKDCFPDEFLTKLSLDIIPNFCVFGGHNTDLIRLVAHKQIKLFNENKESFESDENMSQIIEQMTFFPFLQEIDEEFKFWRGDEYGFKGFFNRVKRLSKRYPFAIRVENEMVHIESNSKDVLTFPDLKDELDWKQLTDKKVHFYNKNGINEMLQLEYGDFIHLAGLKGCEVTNKFIIDYYLSRNYIDSRFRKTIDRIKDSSPLEYFEQISLGKLYLSNNKLI